MQANKAALLVSGAVLLSVVSLASSVYTYQSVKNQKQTVKIEQVVVTPTPAPTPSPTASASGKLKFGMVK